MTTGSRCDWSSPDQQCCFFPTRCTRRESPRESESNQPGTLGKCSKVDQGDWKRRWEGVMTGRKRGDALPKKIEASAALVLITGTPVNPQIAPWLLYFIIAPMPRVEVGRHTTMAQSAFQTWEGAGGRPGRVSRARQVLQKRKAAGQIKCDHPSSTHGLQ